MGVRNAQTLSESHVLNAMGSLVSVSSYKTLNSTNTSVSDFEPMVEALNAIFCCASNFQLRGLPRINFPTH